jgi:hypothetical protein
MAVSLLLCASSLAHAAEPPADLRYQTALDAVLADVANPERSFDFVEAAMAVGDLRGAAAALERILLIDPRLANIQLELGVLYLRMGNGALAQYHILEALRAPNVPDSVRTRAERLLASSGAAGRRNTFRWTASAAFRNDTNANAGPSGNQVYVSDPFNGLPLLATLTSGGETEDSALEGSLGLQHSFAFGDARGSSWDTDLYAFAVKYSDLEALDQLSYGIESGPTWVFAGTADTPISLRLFGAAAAAQLDGEDYFDQTGGGLALSAVWTARTVTQLRVSTERREYDDTLDTSGDVTRFLSDRSGDYLNASLRQIWQIGRFQLSATALAQEVDADTTYQSSSSVGGQLGARVFFNAGAARRPWNLYATTAYRTTDFDAADPFVNRNIVREDKRLDATAGVEVAVSRYLVMSLDLVYSDNDSNLLNYIHDNFSAGVRAQIRF